MPLHCQCGKCDTSVIRCSRAVFSQLRTERDKCHLFILTCAFCLVSLYLVLLFCRGCPRRLFCSRSIRALCRCILFRCTAKTNILLAFCRLSMQRKKNQATTANTAKYALSAISFRQIICLHA